jgi:two-component system NtrC family response regulator/two-component system response regulator AtoC
MAIAESLPMDTNEMPIDADEREPPPRVDKTLREARAEFEQQYLQNLLESFAYDVKAAARVAGISKVHFYRLLRRMRLQRLAKAI